MGFLNTKKIQKKFNTIVLGNNYTTAKNSIVCGDNNTINVKKNAFVVGQNNVIGDGIESTMIAGDNNVITLPIDESGNTTSTVTNITLLGVYNQTITATTNDTVYVPNIQFTSTASTINGTPISNITSVTNNNYITGWARERNFGVSVDIGKGVGKLLLTNGSNVVVGVGTDFNNGSNYDSPALAYEATIYLSGNTYRYISFDSFTSAVDATIWKIFSRPNYSSTNLGSAWDGPTGEYEYYAYFKPLANNELSFSEGYSTEASGKYSHAEGLYSIASGSHSHAEGWKSSAGGTSSHAEGWQTSATTFYSHSQGYKTLANGSSSHAEGDNTIASGISSHAEGTYTIAGGNYSHSEGGRTTASGVASHAEGSGTTASGIYSHAEGINSVAKGLGSHAEGNSIASGTTSHAEGYANEANGDSSHAEGGFTYANGNYSHSEGLNTKANGISSHAGGSQSLARNSGEWARSGNQSGIVNYGYYQYGIVDYIANTTNTTITESFIGGNSAGSERFNINANESYRYKLTMIARSTAGVTKEWVGEGIIKNVSGTVSFVGTPSNSSTWGDAGLSTAVLTISADNTNKTLKVEVTGIAATNITWYGKLEYTKVTA